MILKTPAPFSFLKTVESHGWCRLPPFYLDSKRQILTRVERLDGGKIVELEMEESRAGIQIDFGKDLKSGEVSEIKEKVEWIFRLNEDFSEFYKLCEGEEKLRHVLDGRRMLRSPSVFEDVVKTILTTNTPWQNTIRMTKNLVEMLGESYKGFHTFPTPRSIAKTSSEFLKSKVRTGYRSEYIYELSKKIHEGEIDLEMYKDHRIDTIDLKKELLKLKGVGEYAASCILMLLGRYDFVPVDTWARKLVSREFFNGEKITSKEVCEVFERYGKWKFLAYWFYRWEDEVG